MKKIILLTSTFMGLAASIILLKLFRKPNTNGYRIGILQTASHPALDAAREGFIELLTEKLDKNISFIVKNAQGSISSAQAIAQQFASNKKLHGFYAIATPAAQALHTAERIRPIIIAAVTDPQGLGLMSPSTNVCGVNDMLNVHDIVQTAIKLAPKAQTVGLLYTSGEKNSQILIQKLNQEIVAQGLTPIAFAFSNELDVAGITDLACRKSDVIITPTDNTVALSITLIASSALKHKKPLIVSDQTLLSAGPLAACGVNYKESGRQAGAIAYQTLVNKIQPHLLTIEQAKNCPTQINQDTALKLGMTNLTKENHD